MTRVIVWILLIGYGIDAQAQYLKYSNEFLSVGVGARAAGMGNAVVAGVDDVTAGYWNPAALMVIDEKVQGSLMHNEQFAGIVKHDYGAVSYKYNDKNVFALTVIRLGVDDIPNTLNLVQNGQIDYSRLSSFSAVDYGFIGSYARETGIPNLKVGANFKIIRRVIGSFADAWGFGFDIGAAYEWHKVKIGMVLRDATTTFNVWSFNFTSAEKQVLTQTNNRIPDNNLELTAPKSIVGITYVWEVWKKKISIQPEINADLTFDGQRNVWISSSYFNVDPRMGLEVGYKKIVYLRGGITNFQNEIDIDGNKNLSFMPSVGAGIKINQLTVDYAIANSGSNSSLPHSNIISVKIGFNKKG